MKWTKEDIQRVRDISIANTMGVKHKRRTNIVCPMPDHRDKTASFLIDQDNGYYCFGCGVHGKGFIDFLTELGYSFEEIMDEYGCDTNN